MAVVRARQACRSELLARGTDDLDGKTSFSGKSLLVTGFVSRLSQSRHPHVSIRNNNACISNPSPNMKKFVVTAIGLSLTAMFSSAGSLQPKILAVLRAGDGQLNLKLRQSPIFIDEFATGTFNKAPSATI